MSQIILFLISVLPVIVLGTIVYRKDRNGEPAKLLTKLFLGGIFSCFLTLVISLILGAIFPFFDADYKQMNLLQLIIYVFVGIALVEEVSKWIFAYKISYNDTNFDEIYDAVLYCAFVSLGFAMFENILYVYQGGISTGILRAILAVPGHFCDGVFMGYYFGLSKLSALNNDNKSHKKYLILSILAPSMLHGIYDYCLFTGKKIFLLIFIIFIIYLYELTNKKLKQMASINRKMKYKDNYCPKCGRVVDSDFCPTCGRKNE